MKDAPLHIDARLDWIIAVQEVGTRAERRINCVENSLAGLARQWRSGWVLEPERELRMSLSTATAMLTWIEEHEPAAGSTEKRLLRFIGPETLDSTVPDGWIRILLAPSDTVGT